MKTKDKKLKRYNAILLCFLIILIISLLGIMFYKIFHKEELYSISSRITNMEKSKEYDTDIHKTIGWLRVQGTNIDYPIYGINSYDSEDYPVTESYTWTLNYDTDFHDVLRVYGHNVMNLGPNPLRHDDHFIRMEELMNYLYLDFAEENQYFQLSFGDKEYLYKIFSVSFMKISDMNSYSTGEMKKEEKDEYIQSILKESIYDYDVDISDDDLILSIVTCTRFFGPDDNLDFVVTGRMVRENEKIDNYSVHRTKMYEKVEETMKGAEEDEEQEKA